MKTFMLKKEDVKGRKYFLIDAEGKTLGRLGTYIATLLIGKDKPNYTPHVDSGAGVIVINAEKVKVTGNKMEQKFYKKYSGYPGGLKLTRYKDMLNVKPEEIIKHTVKGMLPKNKLQARRIARLKIYKGSEHTHKAQEPVLLEVK